MLPETDLSATRSILIVDTDTGGLDSAVSLLDGHKLYQVRNVSDAQRKLVEESIELAIIGPGFAHEAGVMEAALLLDIDPNLPIVLVAEDLTTDVLRASIRVVCDPHS